MHIAVPDEIRLYPGEKRIAVTPQTAEKLISKGARITIESGLGSAFGVSNDDFKAAGAEISDDASALLADADLVLRVRQPFTEHVEYLKKNAIQISFLDPFNNIDLVRRIAAQDVSAISMEMIPRTTRAQKMDALSSQANLAGYSTVIIAAERLSKVFPMMMTPAGTINPVRVFIIGVGVAGLQAIATAKRLGARVEAFDTRPVVAEQVQSLGAKFVKIDLGDTGQTKDGYAKELTSEQLERQRQGMAKVCANADVVITTAQLFGRPAPRIVTADMIRKMRPGSIIVDMAVESGGNVEGSKPDKEVDINGVCIIGLGNLPSCTAFHASQVYASNIFNMIDEYWDVEARSFKLDLDDEIIQGCLITHGGEIVNDRIKELAADESKPL